MLVTLRRFVLLLCCLSPLLVAAAARAEEPDMTPALLQAAVRAHG